MKAKRMKIIGITLASAVLLGSIAVTTSVALYVKHGESNGSYGEVSLRSYYESGTGRMPTYDAQGNMIDPGDPYIITRPRHLYNLSRLQGLGVYPTETYFQLGKVGLNGRPQSEGPLCYKDDGSYETVPFLDMSSSNYNLERIVAIGSESSPFYGTFNGNYLEIKNLQVYADPEDVGLFGYTAHGSTVENLFLDNVTINALGYTSEYANLYGPSSTAGTGVSINYSYGGNSKTFTVGSGNEASYVFDASDYFDGDDTALPATMPTITAAWGNAFQYKLQSSGNFVSVSGKNITLDAEEIYSHFKKEKENATDNIALTANSTVSVIAYSVDNLGLEHSKVVMTLEFDFELDITGDDSADINMVVKLGKDHGCNIGFLIGHCDGTVRDCYVHDGTFNMNNNAGGTISGTFNSLSNASEYGIIGAIGGTVYNRAGIESGSATQAGKTVGLLNFTDVYDQIVDSSSFAGHSGSEPDGITYNPIEGTKYEKYLRRSGTPASFNYFTKNKDYVSFAGQMVVKEDELGVFTIATDEMTPGTYGDVGVNLDNSAIHDDGIDIDYLYYTTGEYNKEYVEGRLGHTAPQKVGSAAFRKYVLAMESNTPDEMLLGHHLPAPNEVTVEGFQEREAHQNYFFRFQMTPEYRTNVNDKFYFADVDTETAGGSFISKYFEYKLVDQDYRSIAAGTPKCGVMLRGKRGLLSYELPSFSASFKTPDLSYATDADSLVVKKTLCLSDELDNLAANMVNFEIETEVANVTIVAAPSDSTKSSALGVYKYEEGKVKHLETDDSRRYWNKPFDDPDYAFFMPKPDKLSYFDYKTLDSGSTHTGQIGNYTASGEGSFVEADNHTDTTDSRTEPRAIAGKPRLFVHTFKLPAGRYALGGATGADRDSMCAPKIYYVAAQGQSEGDLDFNTNTFSSDDVVEDIDFLKTARYTYTPGEPGTTTENIRVGQPDAAYSSSSTLLQHKRCYVLFSKDPLKSSFAAASSDITISYNTSTSTLNATSSTPSAINRLAFTNYGTTVTYGAPPTNMGVPNTFISIAGGTRKDDDKIIYPDS